MKVIISHDVDHISVWEHTKDLILPKFIVRSNLELVSGSISIHEYLCRHGDFLKNRWHRVPEVIEVNQSLGIKSTFFFGVNNGVGLSYPVQYAIPWIEHAVTSGFEVGVHGIAFDSFDPMQKEFQLFKEISGLSKFGIRMHYLRKNDNTYSYMEQCGYTYDATDRGMRNPYKIGSMWEFPLQIMDGWVINGKRRMQSRSLSQCIDYTKSQIDEADSNRLKFLSVLFHDRYFSSSFVTWKRWYEWLLDYLQGQGFTFVTHAEAISELEKE